MFIPFKKKETRMVGVVAVVAVVVVPVVVDNVGKCVNVVCILSLTKGYPGVLIVTRVVILIHSYMYVHKYKYILYSVLRSTNVRRYNKFMYVYTPL